MHVLGHDDKSSHVEPVPAAYFFQRSYTRCRGPADPHPHRPYQRSIKGPRLSVLVFHTPLHQLTRFRIHHRSAPFLRALVALSASKSTRSQGADTVIPSLLWVI